MQLTRVVVGLLVFSLVSIGFATESSTDMRLTPVTEKVLRCYGESDPTTQKTSTLTYTDWWRCDGTNVSNEYFTCPTGYVSVGVYTWKYKDWDGSWISRCRAACSKVTAYSPRDNCRWELQE